MPNPPFQPILFPTTIPATVPGGGWNPYTGPQEDGASLYANSGMVRYNGQSQTSKINTASPMPPWELGPGPADPALSAAKAGYQGSGYGPIAQGEVGTINAGANTPVTPGPSPAQVRMYIQGSNLILLDNPTGTAYAAPLAAAVPQPPIYSPTQ